MFFDTTKYVNILQSIYHIYSRQVDINSSILIKKKKCVFILLYIHFYYLFGLLFFLNANRYQSFTVRINALVKQSKMWLYIATGQ